MNLMLKLSQYSIFYFFVKALMFMAFIFSVAEVADTENTPLNEMLVFGRLALRDSLEPPPPLPPWEGGPSEFDFA